MRTKTRIWLLPIISALLFSVGIAVLTWMSTQTSATLTAIGQSSYPLMDLTLQFDRRLDRLVATVQSAVAEGEARLLDDARQQAREADALLRQIAQLGDTAVDAQGLHAALQSYEARAMAAASLLLGTAQGDKKQAVEAMQAALKELQGRLAEARTQAHERFQANLRTAALGVTRSVWVTMAVGALVVATLFVGSWRVIGRVWRELGGEPEYARRVMRRIAAGDLSQPVEVAADDEHSLLAAVREMGQGLTRIVRDVRAGTESISTASREIALGNHDLSHRTEMQAASLEQTAANLQSLTLAVRDNAHAAHRAHDLATASSAVAARGGETALEVSRTMAEIQASSQRIADITGVIDSIAFQTNILALNAAVEAARAGEQGRGFAVVAGEVRTLARRSADAAREIKALIGSSVLRVEAGTRLVEMAGRTMQEIVEMVQVVNERLGDMSQSTQAQSQRIDQINDAVASLDRMTQQNAALVEQAAAAASSMEQQGEQLREAMASFRTPDA